MPLLYATDELEAWLNKQVTLQGEVSRSKVATLLGVEVCSDNPDLHGQQARATGVLRRYTTSPDEAALHSAHRGQAPSIDSSMPIAAH
ncbi:MAG: hypothetical protein OHK0039_36640 [Bacteroidia bacterium]